MRVLLASKPLMADATVNDFPIEREGSREGRGKACRNNGAKNCLPVEGQKHPARWLRQPEPTTRVARAPNL